MAKEELERGVDGGEVTRTWFPPESKRQGNSNSFAFIFHRLIRQTEKDRTLIKVVRVYSNTQASY